MRRFFILAVLVFIGAQLKAQKSFKYQISTNLFINPQHTYTGGGHINFETINKNYNLGLGFTGFTVSNQTNNRYYLKDSVMYRESANKWQHALGLTMNISRSLKLEAYNHRLVYGFQFFAGANSIRTIKQTDYYDTVYLHNTSGAYSDYGWRSKLKFPEVSSTGYKLSFGAALFARLELSVTDRFTFSPALTVPFIAHNESGGRSLNVEPGFNFHLGYRFGKI